MKGKITYVSDVREYMKKDGTMGKVFLVIFETENYTSNGSLFAQEYAVEVNATIHEREYFLDFKNSGSIIKCDLYFHAYEKDGKVWQRITMGNDVSLLMR